MISKNHLKFIKSLQIKKFRRLHNEFIVEGAKNISELLKSDFDISLLFLNQNYAKSCIKDIQTRGIKVHMATEDELSKSGSFTNNNAGIAIAKMKDNIELSPDSDGYTIVLDEVKDPGNLGTIIRIADWYGINKIICSENTAEFYNPKVISATMGSFTRVQVYYCDLVQYLHKYEKSEVYGAFLGGENIYKENFKKSGMLVMGSESNGIREDLLPFINRKITIPARGSAESLNVAIATGIICDNIMRSLD